MIFSEFLNYRYRCPIDCMMSKKRSMFAVFKDNVEEDCEPKLKKKKSIFGVFQDEDLDQKKNEKVKSFKFQKDPREDIKNHFTVTDKKKKPSPAKKVKNENYLDSSSEDEKEVIEEPVKKFSFSKEQDSPKKRISKEKTPFTFDSPRKTLTKNRRSIAKMVRLTNSFGAGAVEDEQSPEKSSKTESKNQQVKSKSKSQKADSQSKKTTSKKKKDKGLAKIDSHFKPISIDDLLKLPETVGDTGLTMDEILDKVDVEIKEQKAKDEANMKILDQTIEKQREKTRALQQRMDDNAVLRDKLTEGLTREAVKELFEKNLPYLEGIRDGTIQSARHDDFHKGPSARQQLLYKMITHPFTDDQVDWTYEEFRSRWMQTTKQFHQINEYIWKVS